MAKLTDKGKSFASLKDAAILPVVCGLGKSRLISNIYPEQFELRRALVDGFKARQNPSPQTTGKNKKKSLHNSL